MKDGVITLKTLIKDAITCTKTISKTLGHDINKLIFPLSFKPAVKLTFRLYQQEI